MAQATLLVRHQVEDYAAWRAVYDSVEPLRTEHGCTDAEVLVDPQAIAAGAFIDVPAGAGAPAHRAVATMFLPAPTAQLANWHRRCAGPRALHAPRKGRPVSIRERFARIGRTRCTSVDRRGRFRSCGIRPRRRPESSARAGRSPRRARRPRFAQAMPDGSRRGPQRPEPPKRSGIWRSRKRCI